MPVDMHEVSTSLSRFIFESPRANDIISFMAILSTDIETLKRWRYDGFCASRRPNAKQPKAPKQSLFHPYGAIYHTNGPKIITLLERSPPTDETTARQWFEVLSEHVRGAVSSQPSLLGTMSPIVLVVLSPEELRKLSETPFVPVKSTGGEGVIQRLPPKRCYFAGIGVTKLHARHFSFVDFGSRANRFLEACGVKYKPHVEEVAQILLADPRKIYELANDREHYLIELRNLAENKWGLAQKTIDRMKESNLLLGSRRVRGSGGGSSNEADEDHWVLQDELLRPNEVAIADDTDAYQLFGGHVFCAPQEDNLEALYLLLGSPRLTSLVTEDCKPTTEIPSITGPETRRLILERLPLFFHGHPQSRTKVKTKVSFDWLNEDTNFVVKVFENLQLTMSLQHGDIRHFEIREVSAFAKRDDKGPIELWLVGNTPVDMHEVSTSLSRFIFESPKTVDILLFMTILSIDMETLKRRGYNVDRILRQQKAERKAHEASKGQSLHSSNATPLSTIDNNIEMATGACMPVGNN
ncbi:hypothetical protein EDB87DRAFT_1716602 [Lactarius vividus]|nr:hypothetical protein EDB87DRAFT_1716602 [Lactarius vividus]